MTAAGDETSSQQTGEKMAVVIDQETGLPILKSKRVEEKYVLHEAFVCVCCVFYFPNINFHVYYREDKSSRYLRAQSSDGVDRKYGFERYTEPGGRTGWLINMHPVSCY